MKELQGGEGRGGRGKWGNEGGANECTSLKEVEQRRRQGVIRGITTPSP